MVEFPTRVSILNVALFALCGVVMALGLAPFGLAYVSFAALSVALWLFGQARSARQAGFWLWAFGTGYFALGLRWLLEPFQVDADLFGWMAPIALALMAAGLALFWGVAGWLALRFGRPWAVIVTLPLAELARAYVFTGFPWAGLAQIWVDESAAQALRLVGPHGLAFAMIALAVFAAFRPRVGVPVAVVGLGAVFALGTVPLNPVPQTDHIIRIVQPNAPQHEKWDPEKGPEFFWRQIEASKAESPPDLIVWPETAIPQLMNHADETLQIVANAARGAPVVLGMQRSEGLRYFNALLVVDTGGAVSTVYDKHHLVPFGEYMPLPKLFQNLGIRALAQQARSGYASGTGPKLIEVAGLKALPLICYEAVFPGYARSPGGRPDLLLQITNDAWFGTYAGPQQHLAQARMRAMEQGLPLVRSANTGISAMIGPRGQVLTSMPMGTHGYVDAALPQTLPRTLYGQTGDWPVAVLLILANGLLVLTAFRRKKIDEKGGDA